MTTVPPPAVKEFPSDSLEKLAYNSVSSIKTVEPNDQSRLGYHVWRWLAFKEGTLEEAVRISGARMLVSEKDAVEIIRENLKKAGVQV